jgi:dolichol-phosphate mannosyltransferase
MTENLQYHLFEDIKLGIVCPMANEKEQVRKFIPAVLKQCKCFKQVTFFAILDNVSKDGTVDIVKKLEQQICELKFVWAPENRCVVDAYIRGYREALAGGCDWILEIDAGFSHQPTEIPQFFETMGRGYDCIFGSRFCKGGRFRNANLKRYLISKGGTLLTNILLGTNLKDMTGGFELFSRSALQIVLNKGIQSRGHFFQTEIKVYCRKLKITEVPITYSNPSSIVSSSVMNDIIAGASHGSKDQCCRYIHCLTQ